MWKWTNRWFTLIIIWDNKHHVSRNPVRKNVDKSAT